jgi:hypothetical protein
LQQHLFDCFQNKPYSARIEGPLKPTYSGSLAFESPISESLVREIDDQPTKLFEISKALQNVRPGFTPPIYIGMAVNIRQRVLRHKKLITDIQDNNAEMDFVKGAAAGEDAEARSFAQDVVARKMSPARLRVTVQTIGAEEKIHNNIENILNRISLPLCGRK